MNMILQNIETLILDLGGVILNLDYDLTAEKFEQLNVPNFQEYFSKAKQNSLFDKFEIGKISATDFRYEFKKMNTGLTDHQINEAWNAMLLDLPKERLDLIESLKKNHRVFLLSNTNEIHVEAFLKIANPISPNNNFRELFHNCYFSNEIGLRKPTADVFKFVLERNNLNPLTTLFIDDSLQHVEGAKKLGIKTHHLLVGKEDILTLLATK